MPRHPLAALFVSLLASLAAVARPSDRPPEPEPDVVATFSVVGYDPEAKEWGVAVASKFLAVGSVVPWAEAGAGAVATQSYANVTFGPKGLELMRKGTTAEGAIKALTDDDEGRDQRQVGMVDAKGEAFTYTGKKCLAWAGGKTGKHFACQGNILAGPEVVDAMAKAFEEAKGPLAWRLMASLEAGDKAGGDRRGKQSAAVCVAKAKGGYAGLNDRYIDFRVDDHKEPIPELVRVLALRLPKPKHEKKD
ncbi:MAG: DUF1028 domain-containing protein [Planctomycetes bacterium]|nr:DUF1028 domain-containing protein [Planctomycetota bacterium]